MSVVRSIVSQSRRVGELAWQLSLVPAKMLGVEAEERIGLPFLAAVTGTAALGVVDWPVALLIAGGYLLGSRQPAQLALPAPQQVPLPAEGPTAARADRRTPEAGSAAAKAPGPATTPPPPAAAAETPPTPKSLNSRTLPSAAASEPWPGYQKLTVPKVIERLDDTDLDLAAVDRYEAQHRNRKMIRSAIAARRV